MDNRNGVFDILVRAPGSARNPFELVRVNSTVEDAG